jgi:hypothetical protein
LLHRGMPEDLKFLIHSANIIGGNNIQVLMKNYRAQIGFGIFLGMAVIMILGGLMGIGGPDGGASLLGGLLTAPFLAGIAYLFHLRYDVLKDGVVIDFNKAELSYPGGGVAFNEVSNLGEPKYMFQWFYRFTNPLSEIRMLRVRDEKRLSLLAAIGGSIEPRFGKDLHRRHHAPQKSLYSYLEFNGAFGAVSYVISRTCRTAA